MEKPQPVVQVIKAIALAIPSLLVIIPFWSVVATSFADQQTINDVRRRHGAVAGRASRSAPTRRSCPAGW